MVKPGFFQGIAEKFGTPVYVYDEAKLLEQIRGLKNSIGSWWSSFQILYAMKANSNRHILKIFEEQGLGIDTVSPGEIALALKVGFGRERILFTGSNITDEEMGFARERGVLLNIDSLSGFERFGTKYPKSSVCIRINPNVGAGHHSHCITGGPKSKFGIWYSETEEIKRIAEAHNLEIIGIHQHIGSQILKPQKFLLAMKALLKVAGEFPCLKFIDFGGGLGVPYRPGEKALDIKALGIAIVRQFDKFCLRIYGRKLELIIEPGRYLVAEAGYLLVRVNTVKRNPDGRVFVGVDSGFNQLIRPAMYGSYHEIENISNPRGRREIVDIVGNLCESGDKFAEQREISRAREGDLLVIKNAGAYGYSMSSHYNLRPRPAEVLIETSGQIKLIRKRETLEDLIGGGE